MKSKQKELINAGHKATEAMKLASVEYKKALESDDLDKYKKMHEEDKLRHDKQLAELKKKGYFTLDDGSKSTDAENVKMLQPKKKKTTSGEVEEEVLVHEPKKAMSAWLYYNGE